MKVYDILRCKSLLVEEKWINNSFAIKHLLNQISWNFQESFLRTRDRKNNFANSLIKPNFN